MARKDVISLFIERYLQAPSRSVYPTPRKPGSRYVPEFHKIIESSKPPLHPDVAEQVFKKLPDKPISATFIRLARSIGITGIPPAAVSSIKWAQTTTRILDGMNEEDQDDVVSRYSKLSSQIVHPDDIHPGMIYTYKYQAETVNDYDVYPLVLVLSRAKNTFIGMNFHYLPLKFRFVLFDSLRPLIVPIPVDELSKINIAYGMLKEGGFDGGLPTIKKYRFDRVKTNAVFITPLEWAVAMAYPSQHFVGKTERVVWKESTSATKI